jgi:hypothetical protein
MGFADALVLGHYADGVVLVSTLGQTHRETLQVFLKGLENVGGRMIGGIVNKLDQGVSLRRLLQALPVFQPPKTAATEFDIPDLILGDGRGEGEKSPRDQHSA